MKHRKILSALLALVMMMALTVPAFAAGTASETVDNTFIRLTLTGAFKKVKIMIPDWGDDDFTLFVVPDNGKCTVTGNVKEESAEMEHPMPFSFGDAITWYLEEERFMSDMFIMPEGYEVMTTDFSAYNEAENKNKIYKFFASDGGVYVTYETAYNELIAQGAIRCIEEPQQPVEPAQPEQPAAGTYTVKYGDTWGQIALNNYGSYGAWRLLWKANGYKGLSAGKDIVLPEKLGSYTRLPAQVLAEGETLYTVKAGDTLGQIAVATYKDINMYKAIFERNSDRLKNANSIYEGQVLVLPVKSEK